MLVALSLGLPPTPAANPRSLSTTAAAAGPSAASSAAETLLRGHQHLLHATKLQHDTQTLAAELAAKERELERELHDDEAENARAAAQLADAKLSLKGQLRDLEAQAERGAADARPPALDDAVARAAADRNELRVVGANLERLRPALADIRRARTARSRLERTVAAEAPRSHPAAEAPRAQPAAGVAQRRRDGRPERSSDDTEWVGATWPSTAARSSECASVRAFD